MEGSPVRGGIQAAERGSGSRRSEFSVRHSVLCQAETGRIFLSSGRALLSSAVPARIQSIPLRRRARARLILEGPAMWMVHSERKLVTGLVKAAFSDS